ncbi:MAG: molybdopterin dinucleotide binding domain-containing protein [Sphingomonadaceae bacterium]
MTFPPIVWPGDVATAHRVRAAIMQSVGLPTRIGLGRTRTLSKVANALAKASEKIWGGVIDLHDTELRRRPLEQRPVGEVWGVGPAPRDHWRFGLSALSYNLKRVRGNPVNAVTKGTLCRSCMSMCPIEVTIEDGLVTKASGDDAAPIYEGFCCPKGRMLPEMQNHPQRLKHSLKRQPDGSYAPISTEQALDEIAAKLGDIISKHGPNAVAVYLGGANLEQAACGSMAPALLNAIGSRMIFSAVTIDQPGMIVASALHGEWDGGRMHPSTWDVFLLVGSNPVISKQYFTQNPGQQLKSMFREQAKLIVIDPRRTETARRAHVHLQAIPGEDPTILAGLIHLVIASDRFDHDFIRENTQGFDRLKAAVVKFTPDYVAKRAGVKVDLLHEAARLLCEARAGDFATGTGAAMAPRGNLTCYLASCLQTLLGLWAREGDLASKPPVLQKPRHRRAQPNPPVPARSGDIKLRARGLQASLAGLPTGALAEEILLPGEGTIRALFMHGGAMLSWPQEDLVRKALESLDLLVVPDIEFSPTAAVATHVLATTTQLEVPVMTQLCEIASTFHHGYGWDEPYAAYRSAVIYPPADSDVIESWQIHYRIAQRLGLQLALTNPFDPMAVPQPLDMTDEPTTDEVFELMCAGSTVPLSEVRRHAHGAIFEQARSIVGQRSPDCLARLELADPEMLVELQKVSEIPERRWLTTSDEWPFLLIARRNHHTTNASHQMVRENLKKSYNPAFLHPLDIAALGLAEGDPVMVASAHGEIYLPVESDPDLRRGTVSISHGFGGGRMKPSDYKGGSNVNRLLRTDIGSDPITGMPHMSAVPVAVRRVVVAAADLVEGSPTDLE